MNLILDELRQRQGGWSKTAGVLKKRFERQRNVARVLSLVGALLATAASQGEGQARYALAGASTLMFVAVAYLTRKSHGDASAQPWVRARAISEQLKRIAYTYAARGKGFSDLAKRDAAVEDALKDVDKDAAPVLTHYVGRHPGSTPPGNMKAEEYLTTRVDAQISFYERDAVRYKAYAARWRSCEFWLALTTALLTGAAGYIGKKTPMGLDFVAYAAVLTSISGAILAHIEASKFDFLVTSYQATAMKLGAEKMLLPDPLPVVGSADWAKFVGACEKHIEMENGSWVLKIGKS